jgi:hypothetical protein
VWNSCVEGRYAYVLMLLQDEMAILQKCFDQWDENSRRSIKFPLTFSNVRKQILWGNRFITFYKKIIIFK